MFCFNQSQSKLFSPADPVRVYALILSDDLYKLHIYSLGEIVKLMMIILNVIFQNSSVLCKVMMIQFILIIAVFVITQTDILLNCRKTQ